MEKKYGVLLKEFTMNTGVQQKEVAKKVGFSAQRVNNYYRDLAEPPFEFLEKFREAFDIDLKVLKNKENKGAHTWVAGSNPMPLFDFDLKPMKELDFFNHSALICYYIDAPLYNDCFAFLRVSGEAMSPDFNPSDIIALKKITDFDNIPLGEPYFIITAEQRLLRYIRLNEANPKTWLLKAVSGDFDNQVIKKADVKYLFQVKGKMTKR